MKIYSMFVEFYTWNDQKIIDPTVSHDSSMIFLKWFWMKLLFLFSDDVSSASVTSQLSVITVEFDNTLPETAKYTATVMKKNL